MSRGRRLFSLLLLGVLATAAAGEAPHEAGHARDDHATATHGFEDVERWVSVFDDPERDAWQKPAEVVDSTSVPGLRCMDALRRIHVGWASRGHPAGGDRA